MTTLYFVRHAESDRSIKNGRARPLTPKGLLDAQKLVSQFHGIALDKIYSSPYRRAMDTLLPLARSRGMQIHPIEDFRERQSDSMQTIEREALTLKQWNDFSYTLSDGECFEEVQRRNLKALQALLSREQGRTLAIGTHGVALCTILHFYQPISVEQFQNILKQMPYVVKLTFDAEKFLTLQAIAL